MSDPVVLNNDGTVALAGGAASGAAIGTALLPGIGTVIGGVLGGIIGFISGLSGKTPHLGYNNLIPIIDPIALAIDKAVKVGVSGNAAVSAELFSGNFMEITAAAIEKCNWWKVGNDQWPQVPHDIRLGTPSEAVYYTMHRLLIWAFGNAPSDKLVDAYQASAEILNKTLYPILNKVCPAVVSQTDNTIAAACGTSSGAAVVSSASSTLTTAAGVASTISTVTNTLKNAWNALTGQDTASTTASGSTSTSKAGFSTIAIVLLGGVFFFVVYNLFKKGKPF